MTAGEALERGRQGFLARFGRAAEGVWLAPGRVNLIGEHTDYQLGLCLPIAIDRHTGLACRRRDDRRLCAYSSSLAAAEGADLDALAPGPRGHWFNYVAGVAAALAPPQGADVYLFGDLPLGAGLSSSAALEVGLGWALNDLFGLGRSAQELALAGQQAEHAFAGVSTGIMDQFASALGQQGRALLLDTRLQRGVPVPWSPEGVGLVLGVVDTRARRQVTGGGYQTRFEQARAAATALGLPSLREAVPADVARLEDPLLRRRARHIVSENGRVLQVVESAARGEWAAVGQTLYASHRSLVEDYEVSHPALDLVVSVARATEGVLGARLTGAGFGGCALVLLEALAEDKFVAGLRAAYAQRGWEPFEYTPVRAAAGARRLDAEGGAQP